MKLETEFDFRNLFLLMTSHPCRGVLPPILGNHCCNKMMHLAVLQNVQPKYAKSRIRKTQSQGSNKAVKLDS
jgi:hypothetical protein